MRDKATTIAGVCDALLQGDRAAASAMARTNYPFAPGSNAGRKYTEYQLTRIFLRDGFVDRYSGQRLVFPGTLRLLSRLMPEDFPAHPNWKMSVSHIVYWELYPTIDHVYPVARGGLDDETNWVTTSMVRNSAKSNWTLEELGWTLLELPLVNAWDGLTPWFLCYLERDQTHFDDRYIRKWHNAAVRAMAGQKPFGT